MKYSREVKTALLAIVAIVLVIFGYSFLKGKNLLDSSKTYHAIYTDVEGLSPSSAVTINGLKVGSVTAIDFLNQAGELLVTFTVDTDFEFSPKSMARVYGGGIIGGKSLAIIPEYEAGNPAKSGDTLPSEIEEGLLELVNDRLTPLQEKIEQAIVSADSLLTSINEVLNEETRTNIQSTFQDLSMTVASLKTSASSIEGVMSRNSGKLDRTFSNLDDMTGNLNEFSDSLAQIDLGLMVANMEKVTADLESVSGKLNSGEGTVGKLLTDPAVYDNIDRATRQMDQLIQDIKLNPRRYVRFSLFGKNPGPYIPPQDSLQ